MVGVASEILLVCGIALVAYGVLWAVDNQMPIYTCGAIGCFYYVQLLVLPLFELGLGLLAASAVGLLYVLMLSRKSPTTKDGTAS
jgi:hypothetical protein